MKNLIFIQIGTVRIGAMGTMAIAAVAVVAVVVAILFALAV